MAYLRIMVFLFTLLSIAGCTNNRDKSKIIIEWIEDISGDYSFIGGWNYSEGIYRNGSGQLVCDGICDSLTDSMRDENGSIYPDSIERYYQLVDTTHYYKTLESEAAMYEWAGADYIDVNRSSDDVVACNTLCSVATHSSLRLIINDGVCVPSVELNSITGPDKGTFECTGGFVKIDKTLWEKGIMKAEFYLTFIDLNNPDTDLWWKGKIYSPIN